MIRFNKPYFTSGEIPYVKDAIDQGRLSGNGKYTKLCHKLFSEKWNFKHNLLTTSCTDALEMAALLIKIKPGDEVIMPTYTFVSTANAFVLRGATIKFVDSRVDHPGIDENKIEELVSNKTKAIVVVHYAGVACDMDKINSIAQRHNLYIIEDAAQAIDSFYKKKPLGSIGDFGTFSFHETKNISSGEGGLLVIRNPEDFKKAEIIWEKGTNRAAFWRGEVNKYGWVDVGSSFLPSDVTAALLYTQLEHIDEIQNQRISHWNQYKNELIDLEEKNFISLPTIPKYASNNGHMFYLLSNSLEERTKLISYLKNMEINAVFHYLCLHESAYFQDKHDGRNLPNAKKYEDCLVRLPLYFELKSEEISYIANAIKKFYS